MKLDPVFLLAPEPEKPKPPSVSRRVFLFTVAGTLGLGGALGFALRGSGPRDNAPPAQPSEGLAWALRLQEEPLEELAANHRTFVMVFAEESDARLLRGIERLSIALLEDDPAVADFRAALAANLAAEIENQPVAAPLRQLGDRLRRIR